MTNQTKTPADFPPGQAVTYADPYGPTEAGVVSSVAGSDHVFVRFLGGVRAVPMGRLTVDPRDWRQGPWESYWDFIEAEGPWEPRVPSLEDITAYEQRVRRLEVELAEARADLTAALVALQPFHVGDVVTVTGRGGRHKDRAAIIRQVKPHSILHILATYYGAFRRKDGEWGTQTVYLGLSGDLEKVEP